MPCSLVPPDGKGVPLPCRCCGPRPRGPPASAVTWTSGFRSSCPSSTEQCSCLDPDRSPVMALNGRGPLSSSVLGPPLAVPAKPLPGVGGRAEGSRTGILVDPLTGDGEQTGAGPLSCEEAPSASPQGGCLGPPGLAGLGERGRGDSPLAGVPLVVASGAWCLWGVGVLACVPRLCVLS